MNFDPKKLTVDELVAKLFNRPRDKRSPEYVSGARAALTQRLTTKATAFPYTLGTAQADAYFGGWDEGVQAWRKWLVEFAERGAAA